MYSRVLKLSIMYSSLSRFSPVEMSQYLSNNVSRKMGWVYGRVLSGTAGRLNGICQQRSLTPADDDAGDVLPGFDTGEDALVRRGNGLAGAFLLVGPDGQRIFLALHKEL